MVLSEQAPQERMSSSMEGPANVTINDTATINNFAYNHSPEDNTSSNAAVRLPAGLKTHCSISKSADASECVPQQRRSDGQYSASIPKFSLTEASSLTMPVSLH